jgi:hypothetical protein
MRLRMERYPGRGWIADRSQQGRMGQCLCLGPLQVNWYKGFRVYWTWPVAVCFYRR